MTTSTATPSVEADRLADQADTLAVLLHDARHYPAGSRVLEVGCGVGAQTVHLVPSSPRRAHHRRSTSRRISLAQARARVGDAAPQAESRGTCRPVRAALRRRARTTTCSSASCSSTWRPGAGALAACAGCSARRHDHRHRGRPRLGVLPPGQRRGRRPRSTATSRLQADGRRRRLIGRQMQPLLTEAGYDRRGGAARAPSTSTTTRPALVEGFTRNTFIAMVAVGAGRGDRRRLITEQAWDRGIADLRRTAEPGGTFHYTFFKAVARGRTASVGGTASRTAVGRAPRAAMLSPSPEMPRAVAHRCERSRRGRARRDGNGEQVPKAATVTSRADSSSRPRRTSRPGVRAQRPPGSGAGSTPRRRRPAPRPADDRDPGRAAHHRPVRARSRVPADAPAGSRTPR